MDYKKHLHYEFGSYVQAENFNGNQQNTNLPYTIGGIYLHPMSNLQERHEIMDLIISIDTARVDSGQLGGLIVIGITSIH